MAASTAPAAKQAILDLLTARFATDPVLNLVKVSWGEPTEQEDLQTEMIFFVEPVTRQPEWRVLRGPEALAPLDETYVLTLAAVTRSFGDDRGSAETRTWELVDEIEQTLRTNSNLRLSGLLHGPLEFGEQEVSTGLRSDGWVGEASIQLVCTARI